MSPPPLLGSTFRTSVSSPEPLMMRILALPALYAKPVGNVSFNVTALRGTSAELVRSRRNPTTSPGATIGFSISLVTLRLLLLRLVLVLTVTEPVDAVESPPPMTEAVFVSDAPAFAATFTVTEIAG